MIPERCAQLQQNKPSESSPKGNDVQDSEDDADKEGQHQMTEDKQVLHDDLDKMIAQEVVSKALDDATRQAFEEEKRNVASQKRTAQATSTNILSTVRSSVSTATMAYICTTSTPTSANTKDSRCFCKWIGIFNGAYDDANVGAVADFNNMDDTINVSHIPTLKIHKNHPKDQILGDPKLAVQTRGNIQKASSAQQALNPRTYHKPYKIKAGLKQCKRNFYSSNYRSALFSYGTIEEEVYVHQPPGFVNPAHPNKVYKDKYVTDTLKKFEFWSIRTATTPIESNKPLVKEEDGEEFQVTPKASHLNEVKRIFRYLKDQPKLGLWYPRDSPFKLEAYSDSDYGGASLDRKSTTGGCQFLGRRLISWQCKKQTIVVNSTTRAEYVAAANCCWQVLWIQNQMMDYGFNFMNTKIHIDNESTISVIKNHVAHSRTKHIEIRFYFIRDCYEKRLIEVIKIHTDHNVADLFTKGFDVTRFNFLVVSIGLLNL
ncbi:hypothetical protein Tco_1184213 [Tanacetum coccineum]